MKGHTHALTGAAAWLTLTVDNTTLAAAAHWHLIPSTTTTVALSGAVLCAGAALAPDADHPDGMIGHSLWPVSQPLCRGVAAISGGHRHATHSLVGVAALYGLALLAVRAPATIVYGRPTVLAAAAIAVLLTAFASKALGLSRELGRVGRRQGAFGSVWNGALSSALGPWLLALGTAGLASWHLGYHWDWLPLCAAIGAATHVLGDALTTEGVPLLWPLNPAPPRWLHRTPIRNLWKSNGYVGFPVLGHTTSFRESVFATLVALYVAYLLAAEGAASYLHHSLY